jgi:hypothetical protein
VFSTKIVSPQNRSGWGGNVFKMSKGCFDHFKRKLFGITLIKEEDGVSIRYLKETAFCTTEFWVVFN